MFRTTKFIYNGIRSSDMGVDFCRVNNEYTDLFTSGREVKMTQSKLQGTTKTNTFLQSVTRNARKFTIDLYSDTFTDDKIRSVAKWLFQDKFLPFEATDVGRVYYCTPTGEPKLNISGDIGYITIEMQCKDEYSYSIPYCYDFVSSTTPTTKVINNCGDVDIYPILEITVNTTNTSIRIQNNSNGGEYLLINPTTYRLQAGEIIKIDCNREIIESSLSSTYRYTDTTGEFIKLLTGDNSLILTGSFDLRMTLNAKYLV